MGNPTSMFADSTISRNSILLNAILTAI